MRASAVCDLLGTERQIELEPVEGLPPEFGLPSFAWRRLVLAPPAAGQGGGGGCFVAEAGLEVVAELRVGLKDLGPEPGGGSRAIPVAVHLRDGQALGVVFRLVPPEDGGQAVAQGDEPLGLEDPVGRWVRPVTPLRAQRVACPQLVERRRVIALLSQGSSQIAVGLSEVGRDPDRRAVYGDRRVELALRRKDIAEVVVGPTVIGIEPDRLAIFGDRRIELALASQGQWPSLWWAQPSLGLSRSAVWY